MKIQDTTGGIKFTGDYLDEAIEYFQENNGGIELRSNQGDIEFTDGGIKFTSRLQEEAVKKRRKQTPIFSGVLNYFPDAIREVAQCSFVGNEQHNPNTPLHWDRSKSGDELDALARHLLEAGTIDTDGIRHSAKVAWRALANLQKEIENSNE